MFDMLPTTRIRPIDCIAFCHAAVEARASSLATLVVKTAISKSFFEEMIAQGLTGDDVIGLLGLMEDSALRLPLMFAAGRFSRDVERQAAAVAPLSPAPSGAKSPKRALR